SPSGMVRTAPTPDAGRITSAYSPDASEKSATQFPSGEAAGSRSATDGDWVRLRISPLSAGAERISPRVSNSTRLPDGVIAACDRIGLQRLEMGPQLRQIGVDRDGHVAQLAGRRVEQLQLAEMVDDDPAGPGRSRLHVEPLRIVD